MPWILIATWAAAQPATEAPTSTSSKQVAAELDTVLEGPGEPWTVEQAIARALDTSPSVARAADNVAAAASETDVARAAALPRLNLRAQYTRLNDINNDPLVPLDFDVVALNQAVDQVQDASAQSVLRAQLDAQAGLADLRIPVVRDRYLLSAQISYPVTQLFLEILPSIRANGNAEEVREHELEASRDVAALSVVRAYFGHARARSAFAVSDLSVQRARDNLARAEARLENAVGNRPDVLRFRARLAEAQAERARLEADVVSSATAVRTLLHLEGEAALAFEEKLTQVPPRDEELLATGLEQAYAERSEMRALDALVKSREASVSAAEGGRWPALSVAAGVDYARPNDLFVPQTEEFRTSYTISGILTWSPDQAWASSRRAKAAESVASSVRQQRTELADRLRTEVVDAKARYRAAFEVFAAAERGTAAAEEAYSARRKGYDLGLFDATSLIDSELDARRARLAWIDAGAALRTRRYELAFALGQIRAGGART
ncbi:MAG: TolC family protein [Myxococcota bacterium]